MYALVGLFAVDRAAFETALSHRSWAGETIHVVIGCIGTAMPVDGVVAQIAAGIWDESFRDDTLPPTA